MTKTNSTVRNVFAVIGWLVFVIALYLYAYGKGKYDTVDRFNTVCKEQMKIKFVDDNENYRCVIVDTTI